MCEIRFRAKQTHGQFSVSHNKAKSIFELIHCDIWGPYRKPSSEGPHYFLTIVDDASGATWVYLMREKGETSQLLKNFIIIAHTRFGKSVKVMRSDNGSEFTSTLMQLFYMEKGILRQSNCIDAPQQNGRVEHKHCHIFNVARPLLFQAHLPKQF